MAHAFKTISAKPTFGSERSNYHQSDVVAQHKFKQLRCLSKHSCRKITSTNNYSDLYLFKSNNSTNCQQFPVSKYNITSGQYTFIDLDGVCTASNQIKTNPSIPFVCDTPVKMLVDPSTGTWNSGQSAFYQDVTIDPNGELFGNSQCGKLNYIDYIHFWGNYLKSI